MTGTGERCAAITRADIGSPWASPHGRDEEASDMVITDDNFASIREAVEEGRVIYGNILRAVKYLLACNAGELVTIFLAILAGLRAPHLHPDLWMNLVTDSPPALALAPTPVTRTSCGARPWTRRHDCLRTACRRDDPGGHLHGRVTLRRLDGTGRSRRRSPGRDGAFSVIILFQKFYALS